MKVSRALVSALTLTVASLAMTSGCGAVLGRITCVAGDNGTCPEGLVCSSEGLCVRGQGAPGDGGGGGGGGGGGDGEGEGEGEGEGLGAACNNTAFEPCVGDLTCSSFTGAGICKEPCGTDEDCQQCSAQKGSPCTCGATPVGNVCD